MYLKVFIIKGPTSSSSDSSRTTSSSSDSSRTTSSSSDSSRTTSSSSDSSRITSHISYYFNGSLIKKIIEFPHVITKLTDQAKSIKKTKKNEDFKVRYTFEIPFSSQLQNKKTKKFRLIKKFKAIYL